jgi:hypothetical protein
LTNQEAQMVRVVRAALIAVTVLGTATRVQAETVLTTPPVWRNAVPAICLIANVGKSAVTGVMELVGPGGTTVTGSGPSPFTLDAGKIFSGGLPTAAGIETLYCRITLTKGSKKAVRAELCVLSSTDLSGPCLSTVEAR